MAPRETNYGSIPKEGSQEEGQPLLSPLQVGAGDTTNGSTTTSSTSRRGGKKDTTKWIIVGVGLAGLILGALLNHFSMLVPTNNNNQEEDLGWKNGSPPPLSVLAPDGDELGLFSVTRAPDASPSTIWGNKTHGPLPTNSWYLNLISHKAAEMPDESTRVYTTPYIIDTAAVFASSSSSTGIGTGGSSAGIRVHWPVPQASSNNIQMVYDFKNGITLGTVDKTISKHYHVDPEQEDLSLLGVTLRWSKNMTDNNSKNVTMSKTKDGDNLEEANGNHSEGGDKEDYMKSWIVRGMPFATMQYHGAVLPSLFSYNSPATKPVVDDGSTKMECGVLNPKDGMIENASIVTVQKEIKLHFRNSDFTWIAFVNQPVDMVCGVTEGDVNTAQFQLNVVGKSKSSSSSTNVLPLVVRLALIDPCTTGKSNIVQHCSENEKMDANLQDEYLQVLRKTFSIIPTNPKVTFVYPKQQQDDSHQNQSSAFINFDWKAQSTLNNNSNETSTATTDNTTSSIDVQDLIMFALPHHQEQLAKASLSSNNYNSTTTTSTATAQITSLCVPTFHGKTCLVQGSKWLLQQDLSRRPQSFMASKPPDAAYIAPLADAITKDIEYKLSDNLMRAAADTYFSGKTMAKAARIIMIAYELKQLAKLQHDNDNDMMYQDDKENVWNSAQAAASVALPDDTQIQVAVERLKKGVQIWLDKSAEAPYLYDKSWGGLVNCGCRYVGKDDKGYCNNTFPDCPALASVNEDFGNGYYNDHHFHYGYHVYAAAVAAKFDPKWGKEHFDKILLYIRDFANPSENDPYFTPFRQKDWWLGSSWASGIVSAENSPHGRNEESSSEAIAAYESMALFGQVMMKAFEIEGGSVEQKNAARLIRDAGELLTITEVEATNRYWHVWSSKTHNNTYPEAYTQPVVGMLYETMASFQTWFSNKGVVSYGIQLMPFTPVGDIRDDPEWASIVYPLYDKSCQEAGDFCVENGWSIIQSGLCATAGKPEEALKQIMTIPEKVFLSEGAIGNSLSNTIWYIATRRSYRG